MHSKGTKPSARSAPNPDDSRPFREGSPAFQRGYEAQKAHGWWKGCPYLYESQDFVDWQAGWRKAWLETN
jgi:ribosome modulation factor